MLLLDMDFRRMDVSTRRDPAGGQGETKRQDGEIVVEIEDFISPTIIERLKEQSGIGSPKIKDWRSMVDCVMIDADYDGDVLTVTLSDVPETKNGLVTGTYTLPGPEEQTTVAVKIIDMLGEEVLEVEDV
jgi:hypothetical protein